MGDKLYFTIQLDLWPFISHDLMIMCDDGEPKESVAKSVINAQPHSAKGQLMTLVN